MLFLIVRKVNEEHEVHVRIEPFMKAGQFLKALLAKKDWPDVENLYCVELERFVDLNEDFLANRIVTGDHLIAF